jgi:peptidoglycan/xylan/chitin deacetylase (PgdA/CDA1 family)
MNKYINAIKKRLADRYVVSSASIPSNVKQISFTFDDVPNSAFLNAQPILDQHELKATFYLALSFLDLDDQNENLYSKDDITKCFSNGHELGCHTYSHIHFYQNSNSNFVERNIQTNQEKLNELGIQETFQNFSYPYGEQTKKSKKVVSGKFNTARSIDHGINRGKVDLHNLKAVKLYEGLHATERIFTILEDLDKTGGWLIFYTHDVQSNYSKYGCSPEYFERIVQKCKEFDIDVKTIKDGLNNLR